MVDRVARFLQREFFGQIHRGEFLVPVMERLRAFGMFDQGEIAFPIAVRQLMHLHLDFDSLVGRLNHAATLRPPWPKVENNIRAVRIPVFPRARQ
jgi:hypothetical protein